MISRECVDTILRLALQEVEQLVEDAHDQGAVAVVDAVELGRLLRAILSGTPEHRPSLDRAKRRLERMQASPENPCAKIMSKAIGTYWTAGKVE